MERWGREEGVVFRAGRGFLGFSFVVWGLGFALGFFGVLGEIFWGCFGTFLRFFGVILGGYLYFETLKPQKQSMGRFVGLTTRLFFKIKAKKTVTFSGK